MRVRMLVLGLLVVATVAAVPAMAANSAIYKCTASGLEIHEDDGNASGTASTTTSLTGVCSAVLGNTFDVAVWGHGTSFFQIIDSSGVIHPAMSWHRTVTLQMTDRATGAVTFFDQRWSSQGLTSRFIVRELPGPKTRGFGSYSGVGLGCEPGVCYSWMRYNFNFAR